MPHPANVHLVEHPLLTHLLTIARDRRTPPALFRDALESVGRQLAYEATRDLPLTRTTIQTPLEPHEGGVLAGTLTIVPILRAGLGLATPMLSLIPAARMGHIGLFRDEQNLEPVHYYQKLPPDTADGPVLLVDPMLATGGSAVAAASLLKRHGCTDIRFLCLLAAPEGIDALTAAHRDVPIYTTAIDRQLNDRGYICPGLGDAGDRLFGTTP